jgi:hypothetical protein
MQTWLASSLIIPDDVEAALSWPLRIEAPSWLLLSAMLPSGTTSIWLLMLVEPGADHNTDTHSASQNCLDCPHFCTYLKKS